MELNYLDYQDVHTQSDAFLHFMQLLDTEMVDSVLKEDRTYQDLEKPVFMKALSKALDCFAEEGDTHLRCFSGKCGSKKCHYECSGVRFVGNASSNYMDLIVLIKEGEVQDVFECTSFFCDEGPVEVKKRVWIVGYDFPSLTEEGQ